MTYRDERQALRERLASAEQEVAALRREAGRAKELERRLHELERRLGERRKRSWTPPPKRAGLGVVGWIVIAAAAVGLGGGYWMLHARAAVPSPASLRRAARAATSSGLTATSTRTLIPVGRGDEGDDPFRVSLVSPPLVGDLIGNGQPSVVVWGTCSKPDAQQGAALRAYDGATGKPLWTACRLFAPSEVEDRHLVLADGVVVATYGRTWVARLAKDGSASWSGTAPSWIRNLRVESTAGERVAERMPRSPNDCRSNHRAILELDGGARPLLVDLSTGRARDDVSAANTASCSSRMAGGALASSEAWETIEDARAEAIDDEEPRVEGAGAADARRSLAIEDGSALVVTRVPSAASKAGARDGGEMRVARIDASTRTPRWSVSLGRGARGKDVSLVVAGKTFFALRGQRLFAFALETGAPLFTLQR